MNNKKINKSIFTGLAAITLFAPMVLHNIHASANNTDDSANQIKTVLQKNNFNQFSISGANNLNPNSMKKNDLNSMPNRLREFYNNYQNLPSNLKHSQTDQMKQALNNVDKNKYSKISNKDVMSNANELNQLAGNVNNAAYESGIIENKADAARQFLINNNSDNVALNYAQSIYGPSLKNISDISDTNALTVVGKLYSLTINNDYSINQYKTLFNGNDVSGNNNANTMYKKANELNSLANTYNSQKSKVDNVNDGKDLQKTLNDKATIVKQFLINNNSDNIALNYAQSIYGSSLKNINDMSNTNALTVAGRLYSFAYNKDFNNVQNNINEVNKLANTYNSQKSKIDNINNITGENKEQRIKDVLDKSSYKLSDNHSNVDDLQSKLSTFANNYNQINNLGHSTQFNNLKQMISKIDGSDLSGKSIDDIINMGINMNNVAKNVKDIKVPQNDSGSSQSSNSYIITTPENNNNSNANNNSHYTKPQMNDGSKEASFPTAPKVSTNKHAKHSKKVSAKQLKKDKASVKKNRKHLKAVKKALKKAKAKARKAKLNKQLKRAKKAFAKSEKKLNHAIHNAK